MHAWCLRNGKEVETKERVDGDWKGEVPGAQILRKTFISHEDCVCQGREMPSIGTALQISGYLYFINLNSFPRVNVLLPLLISTHHIFTHLLSHFRIFCLF